LAVVYAFELAGGPGAETDPKPVGSISDGGQGLADLDPYPGQC